LAAAEGKRRLGFYRQYKQIDLKNVTRLVFVCSGNICRSPLGEIVARSLGVQAESYGLDTRGGDPADDRVINYAKTKQLNLSPHTTRRIAQYVPQNGDLLVGMEPMHAKKLKMLFGNQVPITLVGLWLPRPIVYLHDPYNTHLEFFNCCSTLVESATTQLIDRIRMENR
jgi:protein-tyrosine-phosphatase